MLPQGSGDGGGFRGAGFLWRGVLFAGEELIEPFGMNFAAKKIGFGEDAAEEASVGLDAGYGVFVECAAQARDGFFARVAPGNKFAEEGIVFVGNGPAFVDTFVEANAGTAGRVSRKNLSGRRKEIVVGILGVEANFHGVAAWGDGFPCEREAVAGGDGDLKFDEIESGDLLGDGMLDLQPRVDFEEIEIEISVDEKFHRAGVDVATGTRQANRGIAHFLAEVGCDDGRWSFFDDFLVTALYGAFAFAEGNNAAMAVGQDLDFDMARLFQIFFEIEATVAESVGGFR